MYLHLFLYYLSPCIFSCLFLYTILYSVLLISINLPFKKKIKKISSYFVGFQPTVYNKFLSKTYKYHLQSVYKSKSGNFEKLFILLSSYYNVYMLNCSYYIVYMLNSLLYNVYMLNNSDYIVYML